MKLTVQSGVVFVLLLMTLIAIFILIRRYYANNRAAHISYDKEQGQNNEKYKLFFWVLGVFMPVSELVLELFKVREKSELVSNLIGGSIALLIAFSSEYFKLVKSNLHRLFIVFYSAFNILVFYNISHNSTELVTFCEFLIPLIFAYYIFYDVKHFFGYLIFVLATLIYLQVFDYLEIRVFAIYFMVWLIAFVINYAKYFIDINHRESFFMAYNVVNRGKLIVLGIENDKVVFVSDNLDEILGYNKDEFVGKKWANIISDISVEEHKTDKVGLSVNDAAIQRVRTKNGNQILIEWQEDPYDENFLIKIGRDVTQSRKTEAELHKSNYRLEALLTKSGDLVLVLNKDLVFTEYYNDSSEDLYVKPSFFIGRKIDEVGFPEDTLAAMMDAIEKSKDTSKNISFEYSLSIKGHKQWYNMVISVFLDDDGEPKDFICVARNITERKLSEIELKKTKELLEETSHVARIGGWEYIIESQKIFWSDITKEIHEVPEDFEPDFISAVSFYKDQESREKIERQMQDCISNGRKEEVMAQILTARGNLKWVRSIGQAEFENGVCKRVFGTIQDIDHEVTLNQKIWDSEFQFRTLISNISSVAFRCKNDENWSMIFISDAIERMTGYNSGDFIYNSKRSFASIIHPEDQQVLNQTINHHLERDEEYEHEYRLISVEGHIVWVNERGRGYFSEDGELLFLDGIITDITDRKLAEQKLINVQNQLVYKSEVLSAIGKTTEQLLISSDVISTLKETMCLTGIATKSDRAYYFENDRKTQLVSQKVEWVSEGTEPQIDDPALQNMSLDILTFLKDPFDLNQPFICVTRLLKESGLKTLLEGQDVLSMLLLPVFIKDIFFGFIGFDDCHEERNWSDDEVNLLQSLASNIANAIERINNERIIKESESNFRQINDALEDVFWLFDVNKRQSIFISPSCKKVLGIEEEYFYSRNSYIYDYIIEEDRDLAKRSFKGLLKNNSYDIEYRILDTEENIRWINEKAYAIRNEAGELVRISGICSDITEKKLIENEIKQLSVVARQTRNGVLVTDRNGFALYANDGYLNLFEVTLEQLNKFRPRDLFNFNPAESGASLDDMYDRDFTSEIEVFTYMGAKKWVEVSNTVILDEHGEVEQHIKVLTDITQRKYAEEKLAEERRLLRAIIDNIPMNIYVKDIVTRKVLANKSEVEFCGVKSEEDLIGKSDFDIYPGDAARMYYDQDMYVINTNNEINGVEYKHQNPDGSESWYLVSKLPLKDEEGKVIGLVGLSLDITDRKQSEQLLRESEEKFRFIAENTSDGIIVIENEEVTYTSPSFNKLLAYNFKEENSGDQQIFFDYIHPDDIEHLEKIHSIAIKSRQTSTNFQFRAMNKDGSYHWREDTVTYFYDEKGSVKKVIIVTRDITTRKKSEEELKESQRNLTLILNAMDEVVWAVSFPDRKPLFISPSYYNLSGIRTEDWISDFTIWNSKVHPEDKEIMDAMGRDFSELGYSDRILRIYDANNEIRWVQCKSKIVKNENDMPFMLMGIIVDITQKKNAERELLIAREQADAANRSKVELELRTLQLQMNPHFIFNALNSIQSYVVHNEIITANSYLTKFAHLIRLFLDSSRSKFISLNEEIRLLTFYMELEKLRFENKFDFEISVSPDVNRYQEIPTMILQPFVENAINHGLRYKSSKGKLNINFYFSSDFLICMIEDNGVGRKNANKIQSRSKNGYQSQGLKITAERLTTYSKINGTNIIFSIDDRIKGSDNPDEEVGTVIEIKFPQT